MAATTAAAAAAGTGDAAALQASFGPPELRPDELRLVRRIGQGAFGSVWEAECRHTRVACKVPNESRRFTPEQIAAFKDEVTIMSKIYHPHVALFMGASTTDAKNIRIVSELLAGDVESKVIKERKPISLFTRMQMAKDAATGMAWLHGAGVIHRDFKLSNLLLDVHGTVKVCDFGLSQLCPPGKQLLDEDTPKGTPLYMSPEVMNFDQFDEKTDVYSFGLCLWEFLTRDTVFKHHTSFAAFAEAICDRNERPPLPDACPPSLRALMTQCWDRDPAVRPVFPRVVDLMDPVLIEAAVSDEAGAAFWKARLLHDPVVVPFDRLSAELYAHLALPLPGAAGAGAAGSDPHAAQKLAALRAVLEHIDDVLIKKRRERHLVTSEAFGKVAGWFGPVDAGFVERIWRVLGAKDSTNHHWFHGYLDADEATRKMGSSEQGTFLVRLSANAAYPTWFTISKKMRQEIAHFRVSQNAGRFKLEDSATAQQEYATLEDLISKNANLLELRQACEASPFQAVYLEAGLSSRYVVDTSGTE